MEEKTSSLVPVGHAELCQNMSEMVFDGSLIDVKTKSDISVAHPLGDMRKNL